MGVLLTNIRGGERSRRGDRETGKEGGREGGKEGEKEGGEEDTHPHDQRAPS